MINQAYQMERAEAWNYPKAGHQRIVFLSRPLFHLEPVSKRLRGYQHMLLDANLPAQDDFTIGKHAAQLLIERIEGVDAPPQKEIIDTQLIICASTTPPEISKFPQNHRD